MNIGELKKHLGGIPDGTPCAYALWLPDDVTVAAKDNDLPEPTAEQCEIVLYDMEHWKDANYGMTWDTVVCWLAAAQAINTADSAEG